MRKVDGDVAGSRGAALRAARAGRAVRCALLAAAWLRGDAPAAAQSLVNDLDGSVVYAGTAPIAGAATQIAFAPGDDAHVYVATFGNGIWRFDYQPQTAAFLANPVRAVPHEISGQGGVDGSLGLAFYDDPVHGTTMFLAPAVPFAGGAGVNSLVAQSLLRLTDADGDGIWGNGAADVRQTLVDNVSVSHVHQINHLQVHERTLFAAIGVRTQNGGQTAAQNQAIGGSGVDQSNPGETAYSGTVSFIEDLATLADDVTTPNVAGFAYVDLDGNGVLDDRDVRADAQPFSSQDPGKLRIFATGFRNNYGLAIDDTGELWVSMNQNEDPNLPDELHRGVSFQTDHQFFKGNDRVGDWKIVGDEIAGLANNGSQAAADAGYFVPAKSVSSFAPLGFNTAAGGLDFFAPETLYASLRGDALVSRHSGDGQDVVHVDRTTGALQVVLEGLNGALDVQRDPYGNFLVAARNRLALLRVATSTSPGAVMGDLNQDRRIDVADWRVFKPNFGRDTSGLAPEALLLAGDFDLSGRVDFRDAQRFAELFDAVHGPGGFARASAAAPEPASAALALTLTALGAGRRRRSS